jgi:hypothetical protein
MYSEEYLWHVGFTNEAKRFLTMDNKKCTSSEARFVYIGIVTLAEKTGDGPWHVSALIYDTRKNIIEYFESTNTDRTFGHMPKFGHGYRYDGPIEKIAALYFKSSTYIVTYGSSNRTYFRPLQAGDPYCTTWSLLYMLMKLRFPNMHPHNLLDVFIDTIAKSKVTNQELIAGFSSLLANSLSRPWTTQSRVQYFFDYGKRYTRPENFKDENLLEVEGHPFVKDFLPRIFQEMVNNLT